MNLFSDNKRIIKNNFQILVFPVVPSSSSSSTKEKIVEQISVDLCEVYEPYNNIKEETNPMIKSR